MINLQLGGFWTPAATANWLIAGVSCKGVLGCGAVNDRSTAGCWTLAAGFDPDSRGRQ